MRYDDGHAVGIPPPQIWAGAGIAGTDKTNGRCEKVGCLVEVESNKSGRVTKDRIVRVVRTLDLDLIQSLNYPGLGRPDQISQMYCRMRS